ncbi:hypothetical protein [Priestia megaterium]|uniref:hypothetical protein n=1 Tax=Priestia megaterium TaxID=1404 RepID=UPI001866DD66|nr:hypothetical protein [Priestia megaterium]MBE2977784.1 hypothetical protein [Priestia megaterium]
MLGKQKIKAENNQPHLFTFIEQVQQPYYNASSSNLYNELNVLIQEKSNEEVILECQDHLHNYFQVQRELYYGIDKSNSEIGHILFACFALMADALRNFSSYIKNSEADHLRRELADYLHLKSLLLKYIENNLDNISMNYEFRCTLMDLFYNRL